MADRWVKADMFRVVLFVILVAGCSVLPGHSVVGQTVDVGDPWEDYLRVLQVTGTELHDSFMARPLGNARTLDGPTNHPWARQRYPALGRFESGVRVFFNSTRPSSGVVANDGGVWQGRGVTTALDLRAALHWRGLSVTFQPVVRFTQNSSFPLAPVTFEGASDYAYPWRRIDLPQRFGDDPFWALGLGETNLEIEGLGLAAGVGQRNLWWGPGLRNGIVMSNHADGFPHAYVGTYEPVSTAAGRLEARWIMGRLSASDFFEPTGATRRRFITGLVLTYSPSFLGGLSLGFSRVFYGYVPDEGQPFGDLFLVFQGLRKEGLATSGNPSGDDSRDQLAAVFGRWVFSESGAEVYFEWARNDHAANFTDFLQEPEHSQGYTLGLQRILELSGGDLLALRGELTHLQREATFLLRPSPAYYTHHLVTEGYTHYGQIVGAGVGPGGVQQHLGMELYSPWGRLGGFVQRRVHDNDAFYRWAEDNAGTFESHHVSFDLGLHALIFKEALEFGAGAMVTRETNRWFSGPHLWNVNLLLSARWSMD